MKENEPVMKIKSIQNDYERKEDKKTIDTTPSRSQTNIMMIKKFKCIGMLTIFFFFVLMLFLAENRTELTNKFVCF